MTLIDSSVRFMQSLKPSDVIEGQHAAMTLIASAVSCWHDLSLSFVSPGQFATTTLITSSVTSTGQPHLSVVSGQPLAMIFIASAVRFSQPKIPRYVSDEHFLERDLQRRTVCGNGIDRFRRELVTDPGFKNLKGGAVRGDGIDHVLMFR